MKIKGDLITKEHIDFYQENGFVQVDNVISQEEIVELRAFIDEAMRSESAEKAYKLGKKGDVYYNVLNQKINVWRDHAGMAKYVLNSRFAQMALELSQSSAIRLFHDHALWKMPGDSKPTPWHQDALYWPMNNSSNALSIWIPLDDVDEKNGCMMFVPKSHKNGKLTYIDFTNPENLLDYAQSSGIENNKPITVPMKTGSCTFHHELTFHYAHANHTDKPRRVLAIIYMPDGTIYNGNEHMVADLDKNLIKDQPLIGPFFPILAKRE